MENLKSHTSNFVEPPSKAKSATPYLLYLFSLVSLGIGAAGLGVAIANSKTNANEIQSLQSTIEDLKRENKKLNQNFNSVNNKAFQNERDIDYLQYDLSSVKNDFGRLEEDIVDGFTKNYDWYRPYNGYEYKPWIYQGKNWTESRRHCQNNYGDLAIHGMQDWETRSIIFRALKLDEVDLPIWIGLNQTEDGQYKWLSGDPANPEITFWSDAPKNGSCGTFHPESLYTTTAGCEELYYFVCERSIKYWE